MLAAAGHSSAKSHAFLPPPSLDESGTFLNGANPGAESMWLGDTGAGAEVGRVQ